MPIYTVKFTATIVINGETTIEAENDDDAEHQAETIANDLGNDIPLGWKPYKTKYNIDWEEDSFDIELTEIM